MKSPFPHVYELELSWKDGPTALLAAGPRPQIAAGKPPQFDGSESWWSPEHLLLAAAASCLQQTYMSLAERAGLRTRSFRCAAHGTLDRTEEGFRFTEVRLRVTLHVAAGDEERGRKTLESAKRFCIVANSLKCPVLVEQDAASASSRA